MQTRFSPEQLSDPRIAEANAILRTCVHCGFCTATCPTYVLLGDELDSPRGRIYLIKNMLEQGGAVTADTVKHVDRCLSCLACMTTCPSGVHYMHLVDQARVRIEKEYKRPIADRLMRSLLAFLMPRPGLFGLGLSAARLARPFRGLAAAAGARRIAALLDLVPAPAPKVSLPGAPGIYAAEGAARGRVALLMGCVQSVLDRDINAAAIRLLTRVGYDVVVAGDEPCCGSLTHHMGKERDALAHARRSIDQWTQANVDAVVVTASGCGTTIKDYGHMLRLDSAYADKAAAISAKARDICEFLDETGLPPGTGGLRVAYHAACSLQHGQGVRSQPLDLLRQAGFDVAEVPEGHLCCGSAGTYNIMQPDIALMLRDRKVAHIESVRPDVIAAGNIGCMTQIERGTGIPVVHTVELLDWAYGGPRPAKLDGA